MTAAHTRALPRRGGGTAVPGKIILLNGASSAGKSTLARALQARLDEPFWHYSIDHLLAAQVLPQQRMDAGHFAWADMRPAFFEGFHRSLPALAIAGNNLVVEHIVESREWMDRLLSLLSPFDVFFVGVHCALPELERRELARGDRRIGEARADYQVAHGFGEYDFELSTSHAPDHACTDRSIQAAEENADKLIAAWRHRLRPGAFERMLGHAVAAR
jgi:chloramphenicol 3-O phosphotransferase